LIHFLREAFSNYVAMAPRHEYDLRTSSVPHCFVVSDDAKPFRAMLESDQLIVPHEKGDVTLDKLKDCVFADEGDHEDPEYVEESGESDDSLEYESDNETPSRDYDLRAPGVTKSYEVVDDLEPVTVKLEWDQLIVPHKEGSVTLDNLEKFVFEDEDDNDDPDYEPSIVETVDILDYELEDGIETEEDPSYLDDSAKQDTLDSVVLDLVDNEDLHWSYANKTEEYMASFGVSQFGIKLVDSGLSVIESPISSFSSGMSDGIRQTRRHLRAARRAGEKINIDSCKAKSLLVHMATLFPLNAVLDYMGVNLVETYESSGVDDDDYDDPEYVLSSDESEDNLEFWSESESEEDSDSVSESEEGESESFGSSDWEEADIVNSSDEVASE